MTYRLRSFALAGVLAASAALTLDSLPVRPDTPLRYSSQVVDGRQILAYDNKDAGRIVEAFGDVRHANRIAVFVPGASWQLKNFTKQTDPMSPRRASHTLLAEAKKQDPGAKVAAIAWLGYRTPDGLGVDALRSDRAIAGAPNLAAFTKSLPRKAKVTLVCHSYGSVVCGRAAKDARVDNIVVVGATGMDVGNVGELGTKARVWAAQTPDDAMKYLPGTRVAGFGHGNAPTNDDFGATVFQTGNAHGHSRYYEPGGEAMRNITSIVLGQNGEAKDV